LSIPALSYKGKKEDEDSTSTPMGRLGWWGKRLQSRREEDG